MVADGEVFVCRNLNTATRIFNKILADWLGMRKLLRKIEDYDDSKQFVFENYSGIKFKLSLTDKPIIED